MKQISIINTALKLALVSVAALQIACSTSTSSTPPPADASISGIITAAPISGADVSVFGVDGKVVAGPVKTNAAGQYSLVIPGANLAQDLIVKSSGGGFIDEATTIEGIAGDMFAYISANSLSNGSSVSVTPGSTIVADLVINHKKLLVEAEKAFFDGFGYTPDISITPVDATVAAVDDSDESKLEGLRAAAFSQLAQKLALSHNDQFIMFTALAQDLSDGKPDGLMAEEAIDIVSTDPAKGTVTLPADILMLSANALLDFQIKGKSQMNLTSSYQIDYLPGSMSHKAGRSTFLFGITNSSTGEFETSLDPMVMPLMNMAADHTHSTPLTDVTNNGDGTYTANIYYVMPSAMRGLSMGYWDLGVKVADESVHFYPNVMMSMGDTALVKLKGVDDKIMSMTTGAMESRTYFMFKDKLTSGAGGAGTYNFSMYIAAVENMMSFPTLVTGLVLNEGEMNALPVDCAAIKVSVSVNEGDWAPATSGCTDGLWNIVLTLNDGMDVENQVRVKLTVNGEVKTTGGLITDPDFQTFKLTPNPAAAMPM